jgi:branched-chain amino acid transport system substrate-binding protein
VRARWLCPFPRLASLAATLFALAALAWGLSGCGGVGVSGAANIVGDQLTIYSSLPLRGSAGAISEQIVNGEKLALAEQGARIGPFKIGYVSLDDSNPKSGTWDPGVTATNAKTAAADPTAIAYLGEYDSAATAVSLPLMNAAGILQVSPASPYIGLTSSLDAGQDEPERFYPSGLRTFGRLQPGDPVEAGAQVQLMRQLGVRKVYVLDDQDPFYLPLAQMVVGDAQRAGITVAAHDSLAVAAGASFSGEAEKIAESGAQAVFYAGGNDAGAASLWQALYHADPGLLLLGANPLADESFTSQIGAAAEGTFLTTPALPPALYPFPAERVLSEYRRNFGSAAGAYALYGYEAMSVVLLAISEAGAHGNDRQTVINRFFAIRNRRSVLGRYSIQPNGETTLSRYGVDRVAGGRPVFSHAIDVR